MKKYLKILVIIFMLVIISGCTYQDVSNDPNYIEFFPERNSGWYVNYNNPRLVLDDKYIIDLIPDYRIYGDWLINTGNGDVAITFGTNNLFYIESNFVGEWYWGSNNTVVIVLYPDGNLPPSVSALQFDYIDGSDDFVQFTEYYSNGEYVTFLGVHVTQNEDTL